MKIKQKDIAAKHGVSDAMVSRLLSGDKTTDRWELARDLSKLSGRSAISFIHPKHHIVFTRAYPRTFRL